MDDRTRPPTLAVAITAFNSMRTLPQTLASVRELADRLVVLDSGSTDGSQDAARDAGAEVIDQPWLGFARQKQRALDACRDATWVLLLDSDESLEPDLAAAIRDAIARDDPDIAGYRINRRLHFLGAWLNHTAFPDRVLRLVRGGRGTMRDVQIHEAVEIHGGGRVADLPGICRHDSYASFGDLAQRQVRYALAAADEAKTTGRGGRWYHVLVSPGAAFLRKFLLRSGWRDGRRGFLIAIMDMNYRILEVRRDCGVSDSGR